MRETIAALILCASISILSAEHRRPIIYVAAAESGEIVTLANLNGPRIRNEIVIQMKAFDGRTLWTETAELEPWQRVDFDPGELIRMGQPNRGVIYVFALWPVLLDGKDQTVRLPEHGIDEEVEALWAEIIHRRGK